MLKNPGRLFSSAQRESSSTAQVACSYAAQLKWQSKTQNWNDKNSQPTSSEAVADHALNFSSIFHPTHPPSRKLAGAGFRSSMCEAANYRLDPRAQCLVPVGSPVCQARTSWPPGCGQKPTKCSLAVVRHSKLSSFLLAKQGYPKATPSQVQYWLAHLWASDSLSRFKTVTQRGMFHKSWLSSQLPKQFWFQFHLHYRWYFVSQFESQKH